MTDMFLKANYCMASSTLLPSKTAKFFSIIKSTMIKFLPFPTNSTLISPGNLKSPSGGVGIEHHISSQSRSNLRVNLKVLTKSHRMKTEV